jgi:NAD(P)-dependent dehydrogenase (short-subunit alcohol dehydrogenase family)
MRPLPEQTILITGATDGLGRALAADLAASGAAVLVHGRDEGRGRDTLGEIRDRTPDARVRFVHADLASLAEVRDLAAHVERETGRLDVLVNNAGHDLSGVPLFETSPETARAIFEVNVFGAFWMLLAAGRAMAETGGGSIVNVTSRLGLVGMSGSAWYGASKGALHALTRGAAVEWARLGIRVNSVAPGLTQTAMIDTWIAEQPDPEAFRASRTETIPLGKIATPEEVAAAVVYLASDESASTTGASIAVDGGYTAA